MKQLIFLISMLTLFGSGVSHADEPVNTLDVAQLAAAIDEDGLQCGWDYIHPDGDHVWVDCRLEGKLKNPKFTFIEVRKGQFEQVFVDVDRGDEPLAAMPGPDQMREFTFWVRIADSNGPMSAYGQYHKSLFEKGDDAINIELIIEGGSQVLRYDPPQGVEAEDLQICITDEAGGSYGCYSYDPYRDGFQFWIGNALRQYSYVITDVYGNVYDEGVYEILDESDSGNTENTHINVQFPGDVRRLETKSHHLQEKKIGDGCVEISVVDGNKTCTQHGVAYTIDSKGDTFYYRVFGNYYPHDLEVKVYGWKEPGDGEMTLLTDGDNDRIVGEGKVVIVISGDKGDTFYLYLDYYGVAEVPGPGKG